MEQKDKYFMTPEQEEEMGNTLSAVKGCLIYKEPFPEDIKDAQWVTAEMMDDILADHGQQMEKALDAFLEQEEIEQANQSARLFPEEVMLPPDDVVYGMLKEGVVFRVSAVFEQPGRRGSCLVTEDGIAYYIDSNGILCDDETIYSYQKEPFIYELPKLLDVVFRSCEYRKLSPKDGNNPLVLLSSDMYRLSSKVLATYSKIAECLVVSVQPSGARKPLLAFCK